MARRLIGTGTTNAQGIAIMDHDAQGNPITGYTGVGAGKLQIVAESGTLQSETYELLDCLWVDDGTATGHKTSWYNYQTLLTVDYPSNYDATRVRKLEENDTQRYYYYNDSAISTTKVGGYNSITTPSCMEFDVLSYVGTIQLAFLDNAPTANNRIVEINATGHYKVEADGSTIQVFKDDEAISNKLAFTGTNYRFGFGFNANNEGIVFKDFKVYPI